MTQEDRTTARWHTDSQLFEQSHAHGPDVPSCSTFAQQHYTLGGRTDTRQNLERLYHLSGSMVNFSHLLLPTALLVTLNDKPPKQKKPPQERSPDYYANLGDAIRTLREDIPLLFQRELNFDIYTEDVVFRDPRNSFAGLPNYKTIFWSLRFHGRIFFSKLYVEVKRIWQPEDGVIRMRWTVHGIPRVPWQAEGTFDGISQYKLDGDARIYEHSVDNVILRDPPMQGIGPWLAGLNLISTPAQQPCPGAYFESPEEGSSAAGMVLQAGLCHMAAVRLTVYTMVALHLLNPGPVAAAIAAATSAAAAARGADH